MPRGAPEYHYVLIDYICRVTGGTLRPGDDVCRVEWMERGALAGLEITEGTLGVIERAFDREIGVRPGDRAATVRERRLTGNHFENQR